MFEINDDFLASVGYAVADLSDEQKNTYKREMTEELNARLIERFMPELDDSQLEEFSDIQDNAERATAWLNEFHADYNDMPGFSDLVEAGGRDNAVEFAAATLWMRDAVPDYGELVQQEFMKYHDELVEMRQMVNKTLGIG